MKKYKWIVILVNLLLLLVLFNNSIFEKEKVLSKGKLVLLKLAPVDPRSLMQGDYMTLSYEIASNISMDSITKRGYCVIKLDSNGVASKVRIQKEKKPLTPDEYLIKYFVGQWSINIGAESYFFEEGQSEKYAAAKYGAVKIDEQGNSILIGLYGENLKKIE